MDKLKELDKLIAEVLGINEEAPVKGGVSGVKASGKSTENTGLDLQEILSILQVGTETDGVISSSRDAYETLLRTPHIKEGDMSSTANIVKYFQQFDLVGQKLEAQKCTSLSSLVSKYAVAASLVSIFKQFNRQAGGYVAEGFIAELVGGKTVPVGGGGIEDVLWPRGKPTVGLNLKVKESDYVGGSKTQLLETLGINYYAVWDKTEKKYVGAGKTIPLSKNATAWRNVNSGKNLPVKLEKIVAKGGKGVTVKGHNVLVTSEARLPGGLFYLFFAKSGGDEGTARGLRLVVAKVGIEDLGSLKKVGKYKDWNAVALESVTNPLDRLSDLESMRDVSSHTFATKFDIKSMNEVLKEDAVEVFNSLSQLDTWFGDLKGLLIRYISTLEKAEFNNLKEHLQKGAAIHFEAFNKQCN